MDNLYLPSLPLLACGQSTGFFFSATNSRTGSKVSMICSAGGLCISSGLSSGCINQHEIPEILVVLNPSSSPLSGIGGAKFNQTDIG